MIETVTEVELVRAWQDGDPRAGRELFSVYSDRLRRFFASKVSRGVDDLVQETLLACVEGKDSLRRPEAFKTFLFGVARRRLYRRWRSEHQGAHALDFGLSSVTDLGLTPSNVAAHAQRRNYLVAALQRIPVQLQIAVELFYWEDMSAAEVAAALDIPEGTVRSRLRRAKELLDRGLRGVSVSPTPIASCDAA